MSRYTCSFAVPTSYKDFQASVIAILESCNLDIIYNTGDYLMAREKPGQVAFARLVTVEVLIDKLLATPNELRMNFTVKNEELPLQVDNHCRQIFDLVLEAMLEHNEWKLLESVEN